MAQGGQAPAGFPEGLITYNISKAAAALLVRRLLFAWDDFECAPRGKFLLAEGCSLLTPKENQKSACSAGKASACL